jgi:small-conductance mechanosensitive channel
MSTLLALFEEFHIATTLSAGLLIVLGFFIARIASISIARTFRRRLTRQQTMLTQRISYYVILALFFASAIQQLGFHITALLGATGIITVAIGIASQASLSNIISGLFIIGEKPFEIGNIIKVNDVEGEVMSIDLLSVKIRTYDNMMVRLPNEILVKSAITNISYFPRRRVDLLIGVAYKENLDQVKNILFETAEKNSHCLKEPKPSLLITGFGDFAVNIKFSVWSTNENFSIVKNSIQEDILNAFTTVGIEIPSPGRPLFSTRDIDALPIKVVS